MRMIDADALIADMQERYCKPCKDKGEDYHEVRCRACWVDDAINDVDGFADNSIDIEPKRGEWIDYTCGLGCCGRRIRATDGKERVDE